MCLHHFFNLELSTFYEVVTLRENIIIQNFYLFGNFFMSVYVPSSTSQIQYLQNINIRTKFKSVIKLAVR